MAVDVSVDCARGMVVVPDVQGAGVVRNDEVGHCLDIVVKKNQQYNGRIGATEDKWV